MARRKKHEEHANHEAWAIPYGDLITLLLAFFVVMYAISSINEGKFRVLSDSLNAAFRGNPKSLEPIQVGEKTRGSGADIAVSIVQQSMIEGQPRQLLEAMYNDGARDNGAGPAPHPGAGETGAAQPNPVTEQLARVADELENALQELVNAELVAVRRHEFWLEVEIRTDILFPSGVATLSNKAYPALDALAATLNKYPNPLRVEGHTDNRPINTRYYPSNWELSSARAASVVHRFARGGISPDRLSVIGFGEFRPAKPNDTPEGRNANRRVIIVILAGEGSPAPTDAAGMAEEASRADQPAALPPLAAGGVNQAASLPPADAQTTASQTGSNLSTTTTAPALPSAANPAVGTETAPLPVNTGTGGGNPARE
jgi:chemotaxis protein MotB